MIENIAFKVLLTLLFLTNNISYILSECDVQLEDVDKCALISSIYGNREVKLPVNEEELDAHCRTLSESEKCVFNYIDKCMSGLIKQTMSKPMKKGKEQVALACEDPKGRLEFLKHVKCMTPKENVNQLHICAEKSAVMLSKIMDIEFEDRIPAFCCTLFKYSECLTKSMDEFCGKDETEYWSEVVNDIGDDMITACGEFDSLEKCDKLLNPEIWKSLKEEAASDDPKVLSGKTKYKSLFVLSLNLFKDFQ